MSGALANFVRRLRQNESAAPRSLFGASENFVTRPSRTCACGRRTRGAKPHGAFSKNAKSRSQKSRIRFPKTCQPRKEMATAQKSYCARRFGKVVQAVLKLGQADLATAPPGLEKPRSKIRKRNCTGTAPPSGRAQTRKKMTHPLSPPLLNKKNFDSKIYFSLT